jgi:integrase
VTFTLLLKTGLRDREAAHLEWREVSFERGSIHLHAKPDIGFTIKDYEEREIPAPKDLLTLLKRWRTERPGSRFVIGTAKDRPNVKLLTRLKTRVRAAGLNCKTCDGCHQRGECENWYLHKFRATYCTTLLRSGLDLRTVQAYMGHSTIESTMRYLTPATSSESQSKINKVEFW